MEFGVNKKVEYIDFFINNRNDRDFVNHGVLWIECGEK